MKFKVAEEVALLDFARMCEAYRIEQDESELSEDDLTEWREERAGIVMLMRRGALVVGQDGSCTYTPSTGNSVTFHPATGATMLALETHGKGKDVKNTIAAMADLCRVGAETFTKMGVQDFKACCRIANFFLADR